jgi:hypothetical protein
MLPISRSIFDTTICKLRQALLVIAAPVLVFIMSIQPMHVGAGELTDRQVRIGNSNPSAVTTHRFQFSIPSTASVGSMEFEYCSNTPFVGLPCTAPSGLSVSAATINSQSGVTGFSVHANTTVNRLVINRTASIVGPVSAVITFGNITNPSTVPQTVFVRVATYASTDGTGSRTDEAAVVFSTATTIGVGGYVPPYLTFCVGITVSPDCSSTVGNKVNFGELSSSQTKAATSQMAVATNDVSGYVLSYSGTTMTSGINTITGLVVPTASVTGTSQYGMNLRLNSNPGIGADPAGPGTGNPTTNFNTPNLFSQTNGTIAVSTLSTEYNLFTVSYMVNVPAGQTPGVYSTTATYTATVNF